MSLVMRWAFFSLHQKDALFLDPAEVTTFYLLSWLVFLFVIVAQYLQPPSFVSAGEVILIQMSFLSKEGLNWVFQY